MSAINFVSFNKTEPSITVEHEGLTYKCSLYIDDGFYCITHNNGFCASTSDLYTAASEEASFGDDIDSVLLQFIRDAGEKA